VVDGRKRKHEQRFVGGELEPEQRRAQIAGEAVDRETVGCKARRAEAQHRQEIDVDARVLVDRGRVAQQRGQEVGRAEETRREPIEIISRHLFAFARKQRAPPGQFWRWRIDRRRRRGRKGLSRAILELQAR